MKRLCTLMFILIVLGGTNLNAQSHSVSADAKESYTSSKAVLLKSAEKCRKKTIRSEQRRRCVPTLS
jgi:hypothetical protein